MNMTTEEFLEHHGIKGQKWGIRRFQNKDGSLTNAGRKRYGDDSGGEKSSSAQKRSFSGRKKTSSSISSQKEETQPKKKSVSEMSDDEIQSAINRMRLEQSYTQLLAQTSPKPQSSRGQKFASSLFNDVIKPAAISSGKTVLQDLLTKYMKEITGLSQKDVKALQKEQSQNLKDEVQRLTLEAQRRKLREES